MLEKPVNCRMQNFVVLVSRSFAKAARWLFLAVLIATPWLFGGTRDWTITVMEFALYTAAALWFGGTIGQAYLGTRRAAWGISPSLVFLAGLAGVWGWGITSNAHSYFDPYLLRLIPVSGTAANWPGTVDQQTSEMSMARISALLLAVMVSSYLAHRPEWRRRLLIAIAGTGVTIALFGLAQKITGTPIFIWEPGLFGANSFATYRYHANAAAYLNLTWPICATLAIEAFRTKEAFFARAIWLPGTIVVLAGVGVNVSKGGHLVAVILLLTAILLVLATRRHNRSQHLPGGRWWIVPLTTAVVAGVALITLIGHEGGFRRWEQLFSDQSTQAGRVWMAQACVEMVKDRPLFGFGPGTFSIVFPFFSHSYGSTLAGTWRYAHCDYLQMLVEWGVLGGVIWAGIFFGGVVRVASFLVSADRGARSQSGTVPGLFDAAVLLSLTGVAIHAAFDFPLQIASIQISVAALLGCGWRAQPKFRGGTSLA